MKTRELTADEVNITLSEKDISLIPAAPSAAYPTDETAVKAIETALAIRGKAMNLFVSGPSAPEREKAVLKAAEAMPAGLCRELFLCTDPENPHYPQISCDASSDGYPLSLSDRNRPPVIIEHNPVPNRLFGISDKEISRIRPGSLIRSSGGLLILYAEDLLEEEESWIRLKRALRSGRSAIGKIDRSSDTLIMPEIELDLKVAILGSEAHFDHFYNSDEDFRELFQFLAEFDSVIEMNDETLADSVNHLRNFSASETGLKLSDGAALETIKYSTASAESIKKLTGLYSELEFLLTEAAADPSCREDGTITADAVKDAISNQTARSGLLEKRIIEEIKSGEINLQVDGSETGKVNGLAVIDKGSWSFGFPGLISARIAPGENGLVNIEHEAGLSGEIHDKWVLILEGYLRSRFARDFPISIFASICFEQSYSEIDGDSASSSELYALLSAIAEVPVRQDIAVTGSLSQTGEIQTVGGLREKIEGFYKACRAVNFTGDQGVIVPERNIENIILPDEIVSDIRDGSFHIYPVSTVDDSMELLTGMEAGKRNSRGAFPHGSINFLVEKNLKKLAAQAKNFGG